jgi:lipoprotein-releasing system permease protein
VYKLFLTLRYLRKRRIAYFAVAAVMLCVAMVIIVMSVMGGFLDKVKTRARGLLGDIIVDNRAFGGFPLYQEFLDDVRQWPEVAAATPVIYTYGIIRFPRTEQTGTVRVVGIRLDEVYEVNAFRQSLYYERHYPGTVHLGEQQQPQLGVRWRLLPDGERWRPDVLLPEPLAAALARSRAAGVDDEDAPDQPPGPRIDLPPGQFHLEPFEGPVDVAPGYVGDPRPGVIIGRDIVATRESDGRYSRFYHLGEVVHLSLLQVSPTGLLESVMPAFRYVDDSRTGIFEIDSQHVYCDFDLLQQLLQMGPAERADGTGIAPARCSQIQLKLRPGADARAVATRLQAHYLAFLDDPARDLDPYERRLIQRIEAKTWEESQQHIIAPVEKERILVTILFGIISLVAAVLLLCILYMIVLQKTRDIGILKAVGASSGGVAAIFVCYGAAVGLVGGTLGAIAGFHFVRYINEIQAFLIRLNPAWQVWDRSVYSFDEIPNRVEPVELVAVVIAAVVASTFGSLLAAWRAGRMQPVEALSYE